MPRLLGKLVTLNIQLYRIHSVHKCINVPNFFPLLDPVPFLLTLGLVMRLVWPITHSSKKPFHNWSGLLSLFNKWHKTHHQISSVQFSRSVVSDSLWPHELQHARPPCPSQTPGVYSNTCPLSRWCHPAISSSVVPFSSCPQSLPASGSFPMSQLFAWGGQSIGVLASASVLPLNSQDRSALGWTVWISLQSKELS